MAWRWPWAMKGTSCLLVGKGMLGDPEPYNQQDRSQPPAPLHMWKESQSLKWYQDSGPAIPRLCLTEGKRKGVTPRSPQEVVSEQRRGL